MDLLEEVGRLSDTQFDQVLKQKWFVENSTKIDVTLHWSLELDHLMTLVDHPDWVTSRYNPQSQNILIHIHSLLDVQAEAIASHVCFQTAFALLTGRDDRGVPTSFAIAMALEATQTWNSAWQLTAIKAFSVESDVTSRLSGLSDMPDKRQQALCFVLGRWFRQQYGAKINSVLHEILTPRPFDLAIRAAQITDYDAQVRQMETAMRPQFAWYKAFLTADFMLAFAGLIAILLMGRWIRHHWQFRYAGEPQQWSTFEEKELLDLAGPAFEARPAARTVISPPAPVPPQNPLADRVLEDELEADLDTFFSPHASPTEEVMPPVRTPETKKVEPQPIQRRQAQDDWVIIDDEEDEFGSDFEESVANAWEDDEPRPKTKRADTLSKDLDDFFDRFKS